MLVFLLPGLYLVYEAVFHLRSGGLSDIPFSIVGFLTGNSILVAITGSFFAFIIGLGCALVIAYFDFPGRKFLEAALCLPLALPSYVVATVYKEIAHQYYRLGIDIENLWGAGLVFAFTLYPYFYLLLKNAFQNQSARYIERGKSLGLNTRQLLIKIILPMAQPMIYLGLLLIVMEIISDYGTAYTLGIRTLTIGIYDTWFSMFNPTLAARLSLIAYGVPLLILFVYAKLFRKTSFYNPPNHLIAIKRHVPGRKQSTGLISLLFIPLIVGFIVPFFILIVWTIEKLSVTNTTKLFMDLFNTLSVSIIVTVISVIISIIFVHIKRNSKSLKVVGAASWIICAQYAVPGIVIGIALLFLTRTLYTFSVTRWLLNSIFLIVFASVIRYICFAFFSIEGGMRRISFSLDERAQTLGKSGGYVLFHVHLPLLKPSIMIGGILIFINMIKELTMSLVLQPFHYSSLSIRIFSYSRMDMLKYSGVYAIMLILISIYPVFSLNRWFGSMEGGV